MADTVKLIIDGREIEVARGTTVLQASGMLGLDVPRYCYHPGLSIAGNCRICLVEIEKLPKLATSCTTQAADGMLVRTGGSKVEDGRRAVMEFLLANHPLDCPICDQAGECRLQEYSYEHGQGGSRFREEKVRGFKNKPVGPHVVLDTERCIVCTRCVRFTQEVTGTGELGVFQRGVVSYIDTFPGRELANLYSGNTVDICPVGALTLKEFRFKKRVWELRDVPSVCGACARGCNVHLGTASNAIQRITPRENQAVNRWWMCDVGRLSAEPLAGAARLAEARGRRGQGLEPIPWPEALDILAARLKEARPGAVAAIASASLTLEDLHVLVRLFSALPGGRIVVPERMEGDDDALLIRADKSANAAGASRLGLEVDHGDRALSALLSDAGAGKLDVLLALGDGTPGLQEAGRQAFVCRFTPWDGDGLADADLALPAAAYGEFDGTWVNFQHRAQRVRRALDPPGIALEGWRMLAELLRRLGHPAHYASAADVLAEAAATVPALAALRAGPPGPQGVAL
ncbi:MAG TPA: 2Fe-2S iron-sulfur cluster-binding protein [Candidatus Polarisedimenticolia bacterium]|nr:2Fe-2S iron-sulfur cluster-binding protein [Candidatus Polarisedimenticolia bacterium]